MQHATPEAFRAEAERFRQIADEREAAGRARSAAEYRDCAADCDERANALEEGR
ncbi:hypothetical protein [Streptomyces sp. NPDC008141]|uniref:hypothetical protein n=1 Tax=Streptomyces sp. NPDC008141 TaxID=3364815 RepID=UPI0036E15396